MKEQIIKIIEQGIGEDKNESTNHIRNRNENNGYNQALADLRAKAPEIAQEILDSVVGEVIKTLDKHSYISDDLAGGYAIRVEDIEDLFNLTK